MQRWLFLTAMCLAGCVATAIAGDHTKYNFRSTPEYAALSTATRQKLEQVDRDFSKISAAIKKYAEDHGGANPKSLDVLVPKYLRKLPEDPFATALTAAKKPGYHWEESLCGRGYQYLPDDPWCVCIGSVGLAAFPYGAENNYGLYRGVREQPSRFNPRERIQEEEESKLGVSDQNTAIAGDHTKYNFRTTPEYRALSAENRKKLEQVDGDFAKLSEAIKKYASDHKGSNPPSLEALVPKYLRKLPKDPFASAATAAKKPTAGWQPSLEGRGYQCTRSDTWFFRIASVGLPKFPYLCDRNYGLYRAVRQQPSLFNSCGVTPRVIIQEEEEEKLGIEADTP